MDLLKRAYRCIKKYQYIKRRLNFTRDRNSIDYENASSEKKQYLYLSAIPRISKRCALDKRIDMYRGS